MLQNEIIVNEDSKALRLNVGYLYNKAIGTIRDVSIDFDSIKIDDLHIKNLNSNVRISRTREGLLLQVIGTADIETTCTRCLVDFFLPVQFDFEELYQFPSRQREDTDLILPYDGFLDLNPLYRDYLILAMPIKRLCRPDCKGLCSFCGANLNLTTCEHQSNSSPVDLGDIESTS